MTLDSLKEQINDLAFTIAGFLGTPAGAATAGALGGAAVTGAVALGASALSKPSSPTSTKRKKKHGKRITHTKRGWKQDRKRRSKQKWEVAYQKHKKKHHKTSHKRRKGMHYTKNGQPYIILASGKARFVRKRR